jgi:hypothetical protein
MNYYSGSRCGDSPGVSVNSKLVPDLEQCDLDCLTLSLDIALP